MRSNVWRFLIRTSAFIRKELFGSLRQPRLMLTLVLGPFLILLLFGLGYRVEPQLLRTLFVLGEDSPFRGQLDQYAEDISPQLEMAGTSESLGEALVELRQGNVDLVVTLPERPVESIRNSERAVFTLYHNEIDPFQFRRIISTPSPAFTWTNSTGASSPIWRRIARKKARRWEMPSPKRRRRLRLCGKICRPATGRKRSGIAMSWIRASLL